MIGLAVGFIGCLIGLAALVELVAGHALFALAGHLLGGSLAFAGVLLYERKRWRDDPFAGLLSLVVPCVGGSLCWLHLIGARRTPKGTLIDDYIDYLDVTARMGAASVPRPELAPSPDNLAPLAEVLQSNASDDFKRCAIEGLAKLETPQAVDALRSALSHESVEVRFYAAGALAHLEKRLATRLDTMERNVVTHPDGDPQIQLEFARSCYDYSYYRIARDKRRGELLHRALLNARSAAERGADPAAWLLAGRALMDLGRNDEAEAVFARYLEIRPDEVKALLWLAEARFYQGHYGGVREACTTAARVGTVPRRVEAAIGQWVIPDSGR